MKRAGKLIEGVADEENLRNAYGRARRGKSDRLSVQRFGRYLDEEIRVLSRELLEERWQPGPMHPFRIFDPKERLITAPSFRDRVVHHAMLNVCEPYFERWSIFDSYACRVGKGRLRALERALTFNRRWKNVLQLDVRRYFYRIDHFQLECLLAKRFKDYGLLGAWYRVIESHQASPGKGLPIGCLTSQHFANFYLGVLDRFVKEDLGVKGYVRYMDDMVLWSDSRGELEGWAHRCTEVAQEALALELKPPVIRRVRRGFDFLGARMFGDHWELDRRSRRRFRRKLSILDAAFHLGWWSESVCQERAESLFAHARAGRTKSCRFRRRVLEDLAVNG